MGETNITKHLYKPQLNCILTHCYQIYSIHL